MDKAVKDFGATSSSPYGPSSENMECSCQLCLSSLPRKHRGPPAPMPLPLTLPLEPGSFSHWWRALDLGEGVQTQFLEGDVRGSLLWVAGGRGASGHAIPPI